MNERMNEFPSIFAIFNSGRSSAALWCQKLELQIQIPGREDARHQGTDQSCQWNPISCCKHHHQTLNIEKTHSL